MAKKKPAPKSRFITFEGGEGVGKSTQIRHLMNNLARTGRETMRTREPGGTPRAEAVRSFILQGRSESWGPGAEAVLFAAARLDHVDRLIAPALADGKWVLSDRFHDSTRAYQGTSGGVPVQLIDTLEELALHGHVPDLTIVLDMSPDDAFERVAERAKEAGIPAVADRFEKEDLEWHRRLRDGFLEIVKNNPKRCILIPADQPESILANAVWKAVRDHFPEIGAEGSTG